MIKISWPGTMACYGNNKCSISMLNVDLRIICHTIRNSNNP